MIPINSYVNLVWLDILFFVFSHEEGWRFSPSLHDIEREQIIVIWCER